MGLFDTGLNAAYETESSPNYELTSRDAVASIGIAAALVVGTFALMWVERGTALLETLGRLFWSMPSPILTSLTAGLLVLAGGRFVGLRAVAEERNGIALAVSVALAITFALLGAAFLSYLPMGIQRVVFFGAAGVTTAMTVAVPGLVFTSERSFANADTFAFGLVLVGFGVVFLVGFAGLGTTVMFLSGAAVWTLAAATYLAHEVYMVSDEQYSPITNGLGIYIGLMSLIILAVVLAFFSSDDEY